MSFPYVPTAGDLAYITGSAANAAAKNADIRDGTLTTMLGGVAYEMSDIAGSYSPTIYASDRVVWQRWDTANMTIYSLCDWDTDQDSLIYDEEQLNIGFTPAYIAARPTFTAHLTRNGKTVACYYQTVRAALLTAAEGASSPNVHATRRHWYWATADLPNPANGDADELGIKAVLIELATILGVGVPVSALMLDSEMQTAMLDEGAGGVFQELATLLSETNPVSLFPPSTGAVFASVIANDDAALLDYRFHFPKRTWNYRHQMARQIARSLGGTWASLPVFTDPIREYYSTFDNLDRINHWRSICWSTTLPIDTAVIAQLGQCHSRQTTTAPKISATPWLGQPSLAHGGTTYPIPNPPHNMATALGAALLGGANWFSFWGHNLIYSAPATYKTQLNGETVVANGQWVMETLKRYRALTSRNEALIASWVPAATRMAIFYSQTDFQYEHGRGSTTTSLTDPAGTERTWLGMNGPINLHRAALLTGEPVTVINTEDVEAGGLYAAGYEVILCANAWVLTQAEYDALSAFITAGGTVITHVGSCLSELAIDELDDVYHAYNTGTELAPPYTSTTAMTCREFWAFLRALAAGIMSRLPWSPRFTSRGYSAIANELTADGHNYAVIVPVNFVPGALDAWWVSVSGLSKFCDRGLGGRIKLNEASQDIESGRSYTADQYIGVSPGQTRIVELLGV